PDHGTMTAEAASSWCRQYVARARPSTEEERHVGSTSFVRFLEQVIGPLFGPRVEGTGGGADAFSAQGRGAGDADQGSALAGDEQGVQLAAGGRDPGDHAARVAAVAAANGPFWLSGAGGHAARSALSAAHAGGGSGAHSRAVPGAIPRLQRPALLAACPAGPRGEAFIQLREADPAGGGSAEEGARPGPASKEARAQGVLR